MIRGWIDVEVRDREGRVAAKGRHEMRSFVNNILRVLHGYMNSSDGTPLGDFSSASTTVVGPTGASTSIYIKLYFDGNLNIDRRAGGCPICLGAPDNDDSYGIVVGSSDTPLSLDQYSLGSKIPHGSGAGQLDYGTSTSTETLDTGVTPPVYRLRIVRPFTNTSTGSVTIREVGIYARSYWKREGGVLEDKKYMVGRDVLPTPYTIPAGGSASVSVTLEVVLG